MEYANFRSYFYIFKIYSEILISETIFTSL